MADIELAVTRVSLQKLEEILELETAGVDVTK